MKLFKQIRESFDPLDEARGRKSGGKKKGRKRPTGRGRGKKLSPKMKKMMNRFAKGNSSGKAISKKDLYNQWYGRADWGGPAGKLGGVGDNYKGINYSKHKADADAYEKKSAAAAKKEYDKLYKKIERSYDDFLKQYPLEPNPVRKDYENDDDFWEAEEEHSEYFIEYMLDVGHDIAVEHDMTFDEAAEWAWHFA